MDGDTERARRIGHIAVERRQVAALIEDNREVESVAGAKTTGSRVDENGRTGEMLSGNGH